MVDSVSSATTPTVQTTGDSDAATLADSFDDFLTLLTTQLLNQDPTDPMDSNQFTEQLVQFSGVEQQIKTNQNLETLASLTMMNHQSSLAGYLGKDAIVPGLYGELDPASTDRNTIEWRYNLPAAATGSTIEVYDSQGNKVYSEPGKTASGTYDFVWDGTRTDGTQTLEDGTYSLKVVATDEDGDSVEVGIATKGEVKSVDMTGTEAIFDVAGNLVYQSDIIQLFNN